MITNVTLSTKERYLLEDQKTHEEQCIIKYDNYSNLASDSELKTIFKNLSQKEREHLQTINQLLNGQLPSMGGQSDSGSQQQQNSLQQNSQQQNSQQQNQQGNTSPMMRQVTTEQGFKITDKEMCIDMLSTEKYVSGTYDTAIFEFKDPRIRDVLNHIQKEEQKHGETLFLYMQSKGMYS
jgi:Coat F domain.